jgi:hypothetical protein
MGKHGKFHIRSNGFGVLWLVTCLVDKNLALATCHRIISLTKGRFHGNLNLWMCSIFSHYFLCFG